MISFIKRVNCAAGTACQAVAFARSSVECPAVCAAVKESFQTCSLISLAVFVIGKKRCVSIKSLIDDAV